MRDNLASYGGLPSSPKNIELSSSCPKDWGMKRRTFITQLASKLNELASFSPMKPHRDSQKCIMHIIIFQRCNVIPNFAHLMESSKMQIQEKSTRLADAFGGSLSFLQ